MNHQYSLFWLLANALRGNRWGQELTYLDELRVVLVERCAKVSQTFIRLTFFVRRCRKVTSPSHGPIQFVFAFGELLFETTLRTINYLSMQFTSSPFEIIQSRGIKRYYSYGWLYLGHHGMIENADERCGSSLVVIVQSSRNRSIGWWAAHRLIPRQPGNEKITKMLVTLIDRHFPACCDGMRTQRINFFRWWQRTASLERIDRILSSRTFMARTDRTTAASSVIFKTRAPYRWQREREDM